MLDPEAQAMMADLPLGEVESAATSARFLTNVIVDKKKRQRVNEDVEFVFVYGTLMPGHLRWPAIEPFVAQQTLAAVPGRLYDTGFGYPGAVFAGDGQIEGWLLRLQPGQRGRAISVLDRIEGNQYGPITVTTVDGVNALSYEWAGPVDGMRDLEGVWTGEWKR